MVQSLSSKSSVLKSSKNPFSVTVNKNEKPLRGQEKNCFKNSRESTKFESAKEWLCCQGKTII